MVIQGCTSAYAVWSQLKQESKLSGQGKEIIAYKNVNVRLTKLVKLEYITEIAPHAYTQHGRRDYKVTMKSFELLLPYIMTHPEEVQNIIQYMDKFGLDKEVFAELLTNRVNSTVETLDKYLKVSFVPINKKTLRELEENIKELKESVGLSAGVNRMHEKDHKLLDEAEASHMKGTDEIEEMSEFSDGVKTSPGRKKKPS